MAVRSLQLFSDKPTQGTSERRKKIADMLMAGDGSAPVAYSTGQGLLHAGSKALGGFLGRLADQDEEREQQEASDMLVKAFTGGFDASSVSSPLGGNVSDGGSSGTSSRSGGASRAFASNERTQRAIARLVEKGYSQHAAEGIAENLHDESSMNTNAVGDNGTAFGLAQWRGERFNNLKKFASSQGKDWKDFDTQVDFVDHEMRNGLDQGASVAYAKLKEAPDRNSAYDAFVQHYERPSKAMLQKRLRGGSPVGNSIDTPPQPPSFDTSFAQQRINSGLALMKNPRTREAGFQLMQQGLMEVQALKQKQAELGYQGEVEAYKYRRGRADKEEERLANAEKADNEVVALTPGAKLVRKGTGEVVAEGNAKGPAGDIEVIGPNGEVIRMSGGKKTELNAKYGQFYQRGTQANASLESVEQALADPKQRYVADYAPQMVSDFYNSPQFKLAKQAADNFLVTIIRPDTGAAVTKQEFETYGSIFLPRPNDPPAVLMQKKDAREKALEALKQGMTPEQVLQFAAPNMFDGKSIVPVPMQDKGKANPRDPGKPQKPAPKGVDPEVWKYMTPEEQALWN